MTAAHRNAPPCQTATPPFKPGCSGKARHSRQQAAAAVLRRGAGQAYPCRFCGTWHTSGVPTTVPRKKEPAE